MSLAEYPRLTVASSIKVAGVVIRRTGRVMPPYRSQSVISPGMLCASCRESTPTVRRLSPLRSACVLMQAGAHMVKLEGGGWTAPTVEFLVQRGVPVCAHIGLTPQFVNTFGGYKVQGKSESDAERIMADARALADAGASMVLMECVPAVLAKKITEAISVPTIGIGAGLDVSGQVLVLYDVLGVYPGKKARFVKDFMAGKDSVLARARQLLAPDTSVIFAHRYITRPAEASGENHVALSDLEFAMRRTHGLFAFHWQAHGNHYGIGREIHAWRKAGLTVVVSGSREHFQDVAGVDPETYPVLITAPIELPAIAATRRPRCRAVQAVARPMMPAPTTTRS